MQTQPKDKAYRLEIGVLSSPCFADTVNRIINMSGSSSKAMGCQKKKKKSDFFSLGGQVQTSEDVYQFLWSLRIIPEREN